MKKKGFTLVELLAVIAILAILVLIAIPNVMRIFNKSKQDAFETEVKEIIRIAQQNFLKDYYKPGEKTYSYCMDGTCENNLDMTARDSLEYYVEMNSKGEIEKIFVTDGTFQYTKNGNIRPDDVKDSQTIANINDEQKIKIKDNKVTQNGNTISDDTTQKYKCKRANTFHTETCTQTSTEYHCSAEGFTQTGSKKTTTIKYGNNWSNGVLKAGDAFDCDVNADGIYDSATERFYYVSDYYDTHSKSFDKNYAVLIYYSNVISGQSNSQGAAYDISAEDSNGINYRGPVTGFNELPTTQQWSNFKLKNTTRQILGEEKTKTNITVISGHTLPDFSYSGKAARLITLKEIMNGCGLNQAGTMGKSELKNCLFLFENTQFATPSNPVAGWWTETPRPTNTNDVGVIRCYYRNINYYRTPNNSPSGNKFGIRPAIDVKKTDMQI